MTYLEAALEVLRTSGRAMTTEEITAEALDRGMLRPSGKTPRATMAAVLYCYVRDATDARIQRHAEPGPKRARRGSVTWSFKADTLAESGSR
jgi:HB1, ASXL, restriction endonuclease HTH domain